MEITETEFRNALVDAAELGAQKALLSLGQGKPFMSLKEAQHTYGFTNVRRWQEAGLIELLQDAPNAKIRIDRVKIEAVARAYNRAAYYKPHKL
jgi:allophanate hydrolase subunit 2